MLGNGLEGVAIMRMVSVGVSRRSLDWLCLRGRFVMVRVDEELRDTLRSWNGEDIGCIEGGEMV